MTSPAELANQVRAGIPDVITVHPPGECPYCDALAALSVLEARLEQAEKALGEYEQAADWYRRNLEDIIDRRPVRGLAEARANYDSAHALARGVVGETSE